MIFQTWWYFFLSKLIVQQEVIQEHLKMKSCLSLIILFKDTASHFYGGQTAN